MIIGFNRNLLNSKLTILVFIYLNSQKLGDDEDERNKKQKRNFSSK